MKTKILFIVTKSNFGGAQKQVFDLATSLNKDRFDISVACGGEGILVDKLRAEGVKVIPIFSMARDISILKEFKSLISIYNIIKAERPDVIHLHSPKAGGLGSLAGRLISVGSRLFPNPQPLSPKIFYTSHGWSFNEDRNALEKSLIRIFTWLIIMLSHKTVVLNQKERSQVSGWPFSNTKLVVIPNGIRSETYLPKDDAREKIGQVLKRDISPDSFVVGTIAELHKNKGYKYAIEALSKMPDMTYIIISDGEEEFAMRRQISELHAANIFMTGRVESASQLLKAFDVFLLPSIKESLPYTILEAADASVPIISTDVGGIAEVIKNKESGMLIKPKDPQAIMQSLTFAQKNKHEVQLLMADKLKSLVAVDHTILKMTERLEKLYMK